MSRKYTKITDNDIEKPFPLPWGNKGVYFFDSEPGDCTRYQFLIYRDGPDEFTICPTRSTFKFPQRMNWHDIKDYDMDKAIAAGMGTGVNPHTIMEVIECIRVIKNAD